MYRKPSFISAIIITAVLAVAGSGVYKWTIAHVEYYMGDIARTMNCISCHIYAKGGTIIDRALKSRYLTPMDISICKDGKHLYVTAQDADAMLVVDAVNRKVVSEIPVGKQPHSIIINSSCTIAYVSNMDSNTVSVINLRDGSIISSLPAGLAPAGVALASRGDRLFIANWLGNDISIIDIEKENEIVRLAAGSNPKDMAMSPDSARLLVTNQLSYITHYPEPPVSEVTVINTYNGQVTMRYQLRNAHLLDGVAFSPEGDIALVTLVRPKNLIPALQVERGWMLTNGIALIDLQNDRIIQFPLDDIDSFYADPSDIVITPDGDYAFVSHGGVDVVTVLDMSVLRKLFNSAEGKRAARFANDLALSRQYVLKRIPTEANPRGLAVSPDGKFIYVAERLNDSIGVIDISTLERIDSIDLGGPRHLTVVRRGQRLFHNAGITLHRQFSCRSCHPKQHMDRLQYDFEPDGLGKNIVDNRTLRGISEIGPFKWNGKNTSLYMQCGIRFARFLTRSAPFQMEDLNALVAFITSLEPLPNTDFKKQPNLTLAQKRGKEIFERECISCHPPPYFTNRKKENIASSSTDDSTSTFDTPQLTNIAMTAPYLHDGKALTLEEIWTVYNPDDTHGVTSDIGKDGLNDLIDYLKTL